MNIKLKYQLIITSTGLFLILFLFTLVLSNVHIRPNYNRLNEDETLFFRQAQIYDSGIQKTVQKFIRAMKYHDLWNKMDAIYINVGETKLSHSLNLKAPYQDNDAFQISFPNSATFNANGTDWNGTNQYGIINYRMDGIDLGISLYINEPSNYNNAYIASKNELSKSGNINGIYMYPYDNGNFYGNIGGIVSNGLTSPSQTGFFTVQRIDGNIVRLLHNGIIVGNVSEEFSGYDQDVNHQLYINGQFTDVGKSDGAFQFFAIHRKLADVDVFQLYNLVQGLQTELHREVGIPATLPEIYNYIEQKTDNYFVESVTDSPGYSPRDGAWLVEHKGRLYQLGGWGGDGRRFNDIYTSIDEGVNWILVGTAGWSSRHTFGFAKLNNYYYVYGADVQNPKADVWVSDNLETWTELTNTAPWGYRWLYGYTVHKGYLYIMGGSIGSIHLHTIKKDIWRSENGIKWEEVCSSCLPDNPGHLNASVISFDGKLFLLGTATYENDVNDRKYADIIYVSKDDGVTWESITEWSESPGQYFNVFIWDNKLWVMSGYSQIARITTNFYSNTKRLYYTEDGKNWVRVNLDIPASHATAINPGLGDVFLTSGNLFAEVRRIKKRSNYQDWQVPHK